MLLSICIPNYNSEKYISECLDSIITQQTHIDYELLCLDDGSTDRTYNMIENYKKFGNIKIIKLDRNSGQSIARNIMITHAKGQYLFFVDSDDILSQNALNIISEQISHNNIDILAIGMESFSHDSKYQDLVTQSSLKYKIKGSYQDILSGPEILIQLIKNSDYRESPCVNIIKKSFIQKEHIKFYPRILHEDNLYTYKLFITAKRVKIINDILYYRRIRENSIMTAKRNYKNIYGLFISYCKMIEVLNKNNKLLLLDSCISQPILNTKQFAHYIYSKLSSEEIVKLQQTKLNRNPLFFADFLYKI